MPSTSSMMAAPRMALPEPGGQLADLLQRLHCDADRGGGEDYADKDILKQRIRSLIKETGEEEAADQGHQNSDQGDDEGGTAGLLQFAEISFQTGVEH